MLDANTLEYTDATPLLSVKRQWTVTADANGLKLVNDTGVPGNLKFYGTDGVGAKGWQPASLLSDGNGIYTGDGTIGLGNGDLAVRAKLQANASIFFDYSNVSSNNALRISDTSNDDVNIKLRSRTGNASMIISDFISDAYIQMQTPFTIDTEVRTSGMVVQAPVIIGENGFGGHADHKAVLELNSITGGLLLPRMSDAEFAIYNVGTFQDGTILYNTSSDSIKLRANGSWVDLVSNNANIVASNGLTKVGNLIKLGGDLTENTTINGTANFLLTLTSSRAGGANASVEINNTSGNGVALLTLASGTGAGV